MSDARRSIGRWLLGLTFIGAGINHFVHPAFYVMIMPPYLPWHLELVLVSGAFEILGGVGVLVERTRRLAAYGLMALIVAVFPANLHMALNPEAFAAIPAWVLYARLPFQLVFLGWVYWSALSGYTRSCGSAP